MADNAAKAAKLTQLGRPLQGDDIPWPARLRVLGAWLGLLIFVTFVLVVRLPLSGQVTLDVGDVAPRDVIAPRQITYVSEIQTEQRREIAGNGVPEVYDPPQARIGRQQLTLAGQVTEYVNTVRADSFADEAAKAAAIHAIEGLDLPDPVVNRIVTLPAPAWERVAAEIVVVLERAMREEIRENNLVDERRKVPARVRLDLPDEDVAIVSEIVQDLLVPNSFFNAERTDERREEARAAVEPVAETLERNEVILRAGDIVTDLDVEGLQALGLQQRTWSWQDFRAAVGFVLVIGLVFLYYLWRLEPHLWLRPVNVVLLVLVIAAFMLAAKAAIPARTLSPYIFPYAALTILLGIALNARLAIVVTALFTLAVGFLTGGSLELMTYAFAGSLVGMLKVRRGDRLASFAWGVLYIALINLLVVAAFRLPGGQWDWRGLLELTAAAIGNGLLSITITVVGLYILGALFGVTTSLQLLEISRPTHPLLRQLLLKAPGTYHHTLIVANMSERAAEAIGADALLTRVGAYYHDVGKTIRPYFFVENRTEGMDPHARLDPYTSAQIIITHVRDGMDLARKYRLPQRIIEFIPEHQGTLLVSYFYHQAMQQAGDASTVDKAQFQYPGPKPQSRETALTMLADGAEATVRSRRPASVEELDKIVGESIQSRVLSGQLDECLLTLADLAAIRRAFVDVLRGLHHPRVAYPGEPKEEASLATETPPAAAAQAAPAQPATQTPIAPAGGSNGTEEKEGEEGERFNNPANGQSAF
jgi:cyclic-di-AMP phosphodiesterase PgpH